MFKVQGVYFVSDSLSNGACSEPYWFGARVVRDEEVGRATGGYFFDYSIEHIVAIYILVEDIVEIVFNKAVGHAWLSFFQSLSLSTDVSPEEAKAVGILMLLAIR